MSTPKRILQKYRISQLIVPFVEGALAVGVGAVSGCAGPMTPLGAIWDLRPQWDANHSVATLEDEADDGDDSTQTTTLPARGLASLGFGGARDPHITFDPPHQWLHGPHSLKVIVQDPRGVRDNYGLEVRYHGHDVTRAFLMQARVSRMEQGSRLTIEVPSVRLSPLKEHLIEVGYTNPDTGGHAYSRLKSPVCRAFEHREIRSLDDFRPDPMLTQTIEAISQQMGFNPAFTAALIAQESAFNPQSVSLARALGLTQVTAVAEEEVTHAFPRWPRYPGINGLPAPLLKWLIMTGEINARNEWRLSPERSIRGGLAFARMLANRWQDSEGFSKVSWATGAANDTEVARTRLILASYNSGFTRVIQAINRDGAAWLSAPELKEARRYVNRIFSFCDAFEHVSSESRDPEDSPRGGTNVREWPAQLAPLPPALIQRVMHENEA